MHYDENYALTLVKFQKQATVFKDRSQAFDELHARLKFRRGDRRTLVETKVGGGVKFAVKNRVTGHQLWVNLDKIQAHKNADGTDHLEGIEESFFKRAA